MLLFPVSILFWRFSWFGRFAECAKIEQNMYFNGNGMPNKFGCTAFLSSFIDAHLTLLIHDFNTNSVLDDDLLLLD